MLRHVKISPEGVRGRAVASPHQLLDDGECAEPRLGSAGSEVWVQMGLPWGA